MRKGTLVAGIVCGVICAVCIALYMSLVKQESDSARAEAMERYGGEQVEVLVATRDIYPGETVDTSNSTMRTWLADLLPKDSVSNYDEVRGQKITSLVASGEVISGVRFSSDATSLDIPQGCVALSVPAEDVQAVGGALRAGALVDVYATGSQTACLGQNLLVLATNADGAETGKTEVCWVTLAVPVEQSQEFVQASQSTEIYFTLPATGAKTDTSSNHEGETQ
ncbi:MAG: Flp pilus assembly protein CpaB [Eggerthellaceae bacterium]